MANQSSGIVLTGLKLCLICAVAAFCLGGINGITEPQIIARKAQEEQDALAYLVPSGRIGQRVSVEEEGTVRAYYPVEQGGSLFGYVLDLQGMGYGGEMKLLAAYREDGAIHSSRLLDNLETPGLGKRAETPEYMAMFKGTGGGEKPVPTSKEMLQSGDAASQPSGKTESSFRTWFLGAEAGGGTDAISGATITFLGVSSALAEGSRFVTTELGGK
jgi:electron transport complex protein RnfG